MWLDIALAIFGLLDRHLDVVDVVDVGEVGEVGSLGESHM